MSTPNRICAIVINYFGADKTERCVRSLAGEPLNTLLLVDNSGCEEERKALSSLEMGWARQPLRFTIRLSYNPQNLGFGAAVNRAIASDRAATGGHDYYLLINNDAEATPGFLSRLAEAAGDDLNLGLIAPRIQWGRGRVRYYWYHPYLGHVSRKPFPGSFRYLSGCCLLVDARLAPAGGLFDEDFFMYGEDIYLTARTSAAGRGVLCVDDVTIVHEGTGSSRHGGFFYEYHVARGHIMLADKLARSKTQRTMMLAGRALYLTARAVVRSARYRSLVPTRALVAAWSGASRRVGPAVTNPTDARSAGDQ